MPRRRKVNVTEKKKKRSIEELCYSFTEKKNVTLSLLATLLAVIKCRVKAPEGRMGLLQFSKKYSPSV